MLRCAEEILLLLFNERTGAIHPSFLPRSLDIVLAGAVLMDLALEGRIDTDLEHLTVLDARPLADDILDPTLADIVSDQPHARDIGFWLTRTAKRGGEIRDRSVARLIARGILAGEGDSPLSLSSVVARSRRYPLSDGKTVEEVRLRLMRVLFTEEIPDQRDSVLICLADACGIFEAILSRSERAEVQERIEIVRKLDLIGQALTQAVQHLEAAPRPVPRRRKDIPQAPGLPLIGNAFSLRYNLPSFLTQHYHALGPVFRTRAFNYRFIALVGPEANRFLARDTRHFRSYETWVPFIASVGGASQVMAGMDGPEHIRMRRAHADHYSRKLLENRMNKAVGIMQDQIAEWPLDTPVPVQYAFQRIITTQLCRLIMNADPREYLDDFIYLFQTLLMVHLTRQLPRGVMFLPRFRRASRRMEELARNILADHAPEHSHIRPSDFIDDILELNRTDPHFMPETNLLLTVLESFMVGLDTASTICSFMTYQLLKHPELLARVTAEADALFEQGITAPNDVRHLDVLHRVAMETLRLYPLAPALQRIVANSFEFEDYHIAAGERVLIGFTVPHLMAKYFPNPHGFDIDRYTPERAEHKQPGAYAPFGAGTHRCLGSSLAEVLIALNIATLVHTTELTLAPPDYTLKIKQMPTPRPASSFKVRVAPRR